MPADLAVTVAGLTLKNPVIAGSGESTMDLEGLKAAVDAGAAAVVAKSTNESPSAKRQLAAADYVLLDDRWRPLPLESPSPAPRSSSLFCRSGLVNMPFERWVETLVEADRYATPRGAFVVGSLVVSDPSEAVRMATEMQGAGLRWLELNVGAPHGSESAPGVIRSGFDSETVEQLVRPVKDAVSIPLTVKLGSEGDPLAAAEGALRAGADAVCLLGRQLGFLPDLETRRPVLSTFGAIGGAWALPLALRWVAKARAQFGPGMSLVGTGGARDGLDVARFLLSGASAVEMTTAVLTDGPAALTEALEDLGRYLQHQGRAAAAIVGEACDHVATYEEAIRTEADRAGDTNRGGTA